MWSNASERVQAMCNSVACDVAPYSLLVLGFSGGLDSTVLLDILTTLRDGANELHGISKLIFRAVYIHHGLSRNADHWAAHCAHECFKRNVSFVTARVVFDARLDGIEAAARAARYQAFASMLVEKEVLLTAQHQDDQVETLLLALKRGSGPAGLAGMAADVPFRGHRLLRPLLNYNRAELEAYGHVRKLRWLEDDSNTNLRFDRNFLRHKILPPMCQRWPQFTAAAARSAQLCADQELLLDELLSPTLNAFIQLDGSLRLTELINMSNIKRAALLRRWLSKCGVRMPSFLQLTRLWQDVALSQRDAVAQIQIDNRKVRRFRDRLYVLPLLTTIFDCITILLWPPDNDRLKLPAELGTLIRYLVNVDNNSNSQAFLIGLPKWNVGITGVDRLHDAAMVTVSGFHTSPNATKIITDNKVDIEAITSIAVGTLNDALPAAIVRIPRLDEQVSVRFGPVSGLLYIIGRHRGRKLKKIWQERNVPPWRRNSIPLLFYNDQLIAAIGIFITREGAPQKFDKQLYLFRLSSNSNSSTS
uniref:tRNA lysidine(34) synthetase TilS n=1 Tax=Sodalis endosymbiont of Henestaris halophilus TaxID=1929246 RepID=UPI000BE3D597|nr:tRNA lysidine(34) synthetase TilS [Sodalis endosymbiont of Henestaris halophilus]